MLQLRGVLCAALVASVPLVSASARSDVVTLTASNFSSVVEAESLILVKFFTPWCAHCKVLAPEYEKAAAVLKNKDIKLAQVDCDQDVELCQANEIHGYPIMRLFRNDTKKQVDYRRARTVDGIVQYMLAYALPAVSNVTMENHAQTTEAGKQTTVVAYLSPSSDSLLSEFHSFARDHREEYHFALSTDPDVANAAGVVPPAIVAYRAFDEPKTEYHGAMPNLKADELREWLADLKIPIIAQLTAANYGSYSNSGKPLATLCLDPQDPKNDALLELIRPVAHNHRSSLYMAWLDAVEFEGHCISILQRRHSTWPAFVIQDLEKYANYPLEQSHRVTPEVVEEWIQRFINGDLVPPVRSAPIPEVQDQPVFNLVSKQFDEVVFDESKDVFLEIYTTWCGHCKFMKPAWDALGEKYAPLKDKIVIARLDLADNDLPPSAPFKVSGFPTLKFKPAGTRDFIDYIEKRSLHSFAAFVEKHAKNDLSVPLSDLDSPIDESQAPLV